MKVGLALGGGGARGIAHIRVLQAFEEAGITPHKITGTSIGALFDLMYASGMTSAQIWEEISQLFLYKVNSPLDFLTRREALNWLKLLDFNVSSGSLVKGKKVIEFLSSKLPVTEFEKLPIPCKLIATNYWSREETVFEHGDVLQPLKASIAIPGFFEPVEINQQTYVDGGLTNPVPFNHLDDCDIIVAVNVLGSPQQKQPRLSPNGVDAIFGAFDLMQHSIIREKMHQQKPDIYLDLPIKNVDLFEFHKARRIIKQVTPDCETLTQTLKNLNTLDHRNHLQTPAPSEPKWSRLWKQLFYKR